MIATRIVITIFALVFARYAYLDARYYFRLRKPSKLEDLLHLLLGVCELGLIVGALWPQRLLFLGGAAATAVLGAADEYVFHRGLPADENDYHAKGHLALFIVFVAASVMPGVVGGHRRARVRLGVSSLRGRGPVCRVPVAERQGARSDR